MSDQKPTVIDSKDRWPTPEPEARTESVRGPGIVSVDAQGRIASWNGAAASLLANAGSALAMGAPFARAMRTASTATSMPLDQSMRATTAALRGGCGGSGAG